MITKKSDIDYTFADIFDEEYDFEFEGAVYEKLNEHFEHEFRIILSNDDYDYVEDEELIKKLRVAYDEYRKAKSTISERERDLASLMLKLPPLGDDELSETEMSKLRHEYVDVLIKHKILYHFNDVVADIVWCTDEPNETEAEMLDSLTSNLYSSELFDIALKKTEE